MLATLVEAPFDDKEWVFETKYDGYRALARLDGKGTVKLYSRNLISFNERYAPIVKELKAIEHEALLDGEIVIEDKNRVSRFQLLQRYLQESKGQLIYYVFDLLYLNGNDIRHLSLLERKSLLKDLLEQAGAPHVRFSKQVVGKGTATFAKAKERGYEGIIAKHGTSIYAAGTRSTEWQKIKISKEQEAIIIGITTPHGSRSHFGAIALAAYERKKLIYLGNCGTGFDEKTLESLYNLLMPHFIDHSPFDGPPPINKNIQWVKPKIVCQIKFTEWTSENHFRHPVFLGLRTDKKATEVHPERVKK